MNGDTPSSGTDDPHVREALLLEAKRQLLAMVVDLADENYRLRHINRQLLGVLTPSGSDAVPS